MSLIVILRFSLRLSGHAHPVLLIPIQYPLSIPVHRMCVCTIIAQKAEICATISWLYGVNPPNLVFILPIKSPSSVLILFNQCPSSVHLHGVSILPICWPPSPASYSVSLSSYPGPHSVSIVSSHSSFSVPCPCTVSLFPIQLHLLQTLACQSCPSVGHPQASILP